MLQSTGIFNKSNYQACNKLVFTRLLVSNPENTFLFDENWYLVIVAIVFWNWSNLTYTQVCLGFYSEIVIHTFMDILFEGVHMFQSGIFVKK